MPKPHPLYEIFVYSPAMEGIHLRGGKIARGGIRWSDRKEDYRTEVLGLMKAQMVKNAVIVPVGSKGGFVLKRQPADREALRAEVVAQYATLMRGMLDLTDNLVGGEVVHPPDVRVLDEDDPYLVVAADKGTATFSDSRTRSRRSTASGSATPSPRAARTATTTRSSAITARGAWESVKRHFRELGHDVATRAVHRRRDRRHVRATSSATGCCSPTRSGSSPPSTTATSSSTPIPTPPSSFAERKRLFELAALVVGRLRPREALAGRRRLVAAGEVDPALARGAPRRSAIEVGERRRRPSEVIARDPPRAGRPVLERRHRHVREGVGRDARGRRRPRERRDPRRTAPSSACRVVGEGGNLGFTQKGRIEYARCRRPHQHRLRSTTRPASTARTTR